MEKYISNIEMLQEEIKIHIASGKKIKATKKGDFVGMYEEQKVRINKRMKLKKIFKIR